MQHTRAVIEMNMPLFVSSTSILEICFDYNLYNLEKICFALKAENNVKYALNEINIFFFTFLRYAFYLHNCIFFSRRPLLEKWTTNSVYARKKVYRVSQIFFNKVYALYLDFVHIFSFIVN